jgi:hypothetical protein
MPRSGAAVSRGADQSYRFEADRLRERIERRRAQEAAETRHAGDGPRSAGATELAPENDWSADFPAWGSPADAPARRTVTITGHGAEGFESRNGTRPSASQRHRQLKRHEREGFQPDRVAMWAFLLGVLLILAAAASAHA